MNQFSQDNTRTHRHIATALLAAIILPLLFTANSELFRALMTGFLSLLNVNLQGDTNLVPTPPIPPACPNQSIGPNLWAPIEYDPTLVKDFSASNRNKELKNKLALIERARHQLLRDRGFLCFHNGVKPAYIVLTSKNHPLFQKGSLGQFRPLDNEDLIILPYQPYFTIDHYVQSLRNEFFHQEITTINLARGIPMSSQFKGYPFLTPDGSISEADFQAYKYSIDVFISKANTYTPMPFSVKRTKLQQAIKYKMITPINANGLFHLTKLGKENYNTWFSGKCRKKYCVYQHSTKYNKKDVSRAEALIGDLYQLLISSFESSNGPYANLKEHSKYAELGSTIAQLSPDILKYLAPDFF